MPHTEAYYSRVRSINSYYPNNDVLLKPKESLLDTYDKLKNQFRYIQYDDGMTLKEAEKLNDYIIQRLKLIQNEIWNQTLDDNYISESEKVITKDVTCGIDFRTGCIVVKEEKVTEKVLTYSRGKGNRSLLNRSEPIKEKTKKIPREFDIAKCRQLKIEIAAEKKFFGFHFNLLPKVLSEVPNSNQGKISVYFDKVGHPVFIESIEDEPVRAASSSSAKLSVSSPLLAPPRAASPAKSSDSSPPASPKAVSSNESSPPQSPPRAATPQLSAREKMKLLIEERDEILRRVAARKRWAELQAQRAPSLSKLSG